MKLNFKLKLDPNRKFPVKCPKCGHKLYFALRQKEIICPRCNQHIKITNR